MFIILNIILLCVSMDVILAGGGGQQVPAPRINYLGYASIDQCNGEDSNNYTFITQYTKDQWCNFGSADVLDANRLIACNSKQRVVNNLLTIAQSAQTAGAYYQEESLYLVRSGNLEGKYIYTKEIGLRDIFLKKCSSLLGYSYFTTKSLVLLIAPKLELNTFVAPAGGYEVFKNTATTTCKGRAYYF